MNKKQTIIEALQAGETVSYRESGNSMVPIIRSRQLITAEPIADYPCLKKGDVVFCKVRGMTITHKITAIKGKGEDLQFQISNNHGHVNGWTSWRNVYGKVTGVED